MKRLLIPIVLAVLTAALAGCTCNSPDEGNLPEAKVDSLVKVKIHRYEMALFAISQNDLKNGLLKIQPEFRFFLDGNINDTANLHQLRNYLNDPLMIDNYKAVVKKYPDLSGLERELSLALSYYKHYFPEKKTPAVYTYVCGMDFEQPVIFADSVLIIALDMFLGEDYPLYTSYGLPQFYRKYMDAPYLLRGCVSAMADYYCYAELRDGACIDYMLNAGKKLYFMDALMPKVHDSVKIQYSASQLDWCYGNEARIWAYFIDNKLLYSKDYHQFMKFFTPGPFTTAFTRKSAPRVGAWIGWRIVREYMKQNPKITLRGLLSENDGQKVLSQSKYKPRKP